MARSMWRLSGGVMIGCADDATEECSFAEAEIAHVFSEVSLRRFAKSSNRKAAAISEIDLIGVELKDLLLREAMIDFDRHQNFFHLTAPLSLGGEEKAASHLHVDRAGALGLLPHAEIGQGSANHAHPVEPAMLEETFVFGGDYGINENLR